MSTPSVKFLNHPELVAHTTSFLDAVDISRWMRTSQHALHQLRPCLYYKLQLHPGAIKAFARNARYVKSWIGDEWGISDYYCSLLAYKEHTEAEQEERKSTATIIQWNPPGPATTTTTTTTSSSRIDIRILSWPSPLLPTNDGCYLEESVILLPPFPSLHQVDLKFRTAARVPMGDWWFDFGRLLAKTCWILQVHRFTLGRLSLKDVAVKGDRDESVIVQTIRSLELLQELELSLIEAHGWVCHAVASRVFFALPPSVQQVKISSDVIVHEDLPSLGCFDFTAAEKYFFSRREWEWDESQPEWSEHEDGNGGKPPLEQLRTLHLWSFDQYVPKGAITSILKHAPQLEELGLSSLIDGVDLGGRALGELCPNLRRLVYTPGREPLSYRPLVFGKKEINDKQALRILGGFPHRLERADLLPFLYGPDETAFRFAVDLHSATLRRFVLTSGSRVYSEAICLVLAECKGLEWVEAVEGKVGLGDAVARPWACTQVRHLELMVRIPNLTSSSAVTHFGVLQEPQAIPYYQRTPSITLTDQEWEQIQMLKVLYRQIGKLDQLEYLDLRAEGMVYLSSSGTSHCNNAFPWLMTLGDEEAGRPGFLDLLGELKWLKELRGSVRADAKEFWAMMGEREIEWMLVHWPRLHTAEFFALREDITEPFRNMQARSQCPLRLSVIE